MKPPKGLPPGTHQITQVTLIQRITRGYDDDLAFTRDGSALLFTRMSVQRPTEIQRLILPSKIDPYDPPMGEQLTHLNDAVLSQVAMSPLEPFWFTGAHGDKVEGFLVKPPNFDPSKKYPVKFLIHGGPEGAWGDDWSYRWNPELFAANGYVVIMINFHGSTGYGQKFIDAINGDWGGAPFEDLMKGLDYAEKTYPFIDKDRECALGASYGGYMANWVLGHTDRFKCIVSHDGMFNTISAWGTTEELWFNQWEFKGTPYTNREMYEKWSPSNCGEKFQDADARRPRTARLPPRRERRLPAFHDAANDGRAVQNALLPRRRPLGAEAAEFSALVEDGQRLGRSMDWDKETIADTVCPRKK